MNFIDYCNKLYNKILVTDFSEIKVTSFESLLKSISLPGAAYSPEAFTKYYRIEIESIINEDLTPILKSEKKVKEIKENWFYDKYAPFYSLIFLFRIWQGNVKFSDSDLNKIIRGIFLGTMGYRLIDMYSDDETSQKELFYLGGYLIRLYENNFNNVLGLQNSYEIVNYYGMRYAEIEYAEKNNLWKNCPFVWDEVHILGYKIAPLISIFHALFKYSGINDEEAKDTTRALLYFFAASQLVDDLADALSDLNVGRETLALEGFYKKYGTEKIYTQKQVDKFLTQERLFKIHDVRELLLNKANEIFSKNHENILMMWVAITKLSRKKIFEFIKIDT